jgi:phage terminase large subunit-like protein
LKQKQLELSRAQANIKNELPHLYGKKFYPWARKFFDSENRINLLCAANQISKSSTAIRRCIADACDPERWVKLWGEGVKPGQFWYFYPDSLTLLREWNTKWQEWMPNGSMKSDPHYGWKVVTEKSVPVSITFNSGVIVFFQFYTKKASNVQSSTVHEIFVDEELPMQFFDELMFRLTNTNGIFNAVFTPTLNQLFWRKAMETDSVLKTAQKQIVSMYDCLTYEDGTPGHFTAEKIKTIIGNCKSETEVQRRVFGRFITEQGRSYYAFDYDRHMVKTKELVNYSCYCAVDSGSGGATGHPAAIVFIAVAADCKVGYVVKAWRGDGVETTAGDVFMKYLELKKDLKYPLVHSTYDHASKDFATIAERSGITFIKAVKSRDLGEETVNTLFKNDMLFVMETDHESEKLCAELMHLMHDTTNGKNKKDDDLSDALRYCCLAIPWDFSAVEEKARERAGEIKETVKPKTDDELMREQIEQRRGAFVKKPQSQDEWQEMTDEMEYWNEQYG